MDKIDDSIEMKANKDAFEGLVDDYERLFLYPAEAQVLDRFRDQWEGFSVLDLGVGAGRTAWIFSQQTPEYVGIDYAEEMIERCHIRLPKADHRSFAMGDARDLSRFADGHFDFVIFSNNGLDYINHEDRKKALKEIHRVLGPKGWFFFSTHSLDAFPFRQAHPGKLRGILSPVGFAFRKVIELRMKFLNRATNTTEVKERGWAYLNDFFHEVLTYYIDPKLQVETLEEMGFHFDSAWDREGRKFDFEPSSEDWMIQFLFQKK